MMGVELGVMAGVAICVAQRHGFSAASGALFQCCQAPVLRNGRLGGVG